MDKEKYLQFCDSHYIPIYSQSWWMDAVCGSENWDAHVFEIEGNAMGAMAFYKEKRGTYNYITKAPLTQANGIIFAYPETIKASSIPSFEEKVISLANEFIESLQLDVYEQQYSVSFKNWSPFFWKHYQAIPRYTYIFTSEQLKNLDSVWNGMDKKKRREINKGENNCLIKINALDANCFYEEVRKVYDKQNVAVPFSFELWERLYNATMEHHSGHILSAHNNDGTVLSTKFLVWDERTMYALISGGDVKFQPLETKSALDWYAIRDAAGRGLNYDFEGSMIERIAKAYRAFGASPTVYYRIRKVFNPEIIRKEAESQIKKLEAEKGTTL